MMRMDPNSNRFVCRSCLERKPAQKQEQPKNVAEAKTQKNEPYKEYFCKQCKYNFKRASNIEIGACPFCGASNTLMVKGSAARIIADAAKMKDDFEFKRK